MRYVAATVVVSIVAFCSLSANTQELTEEQQGPWSALQQQVALFIKQDWAEHDKYIHPKAIFGDEDWPAPVTAVRMQKYTEALFKDADEVVAHYMTPVSVTVAGDVAIINCYLQILRKKDGQSVESTLRLHNTWKKENGRWQLLSTFNAAVKSDAPPE